MHPAQPGILAAVPRSASYLTFNLKGGAQSKQALRLLARATDGKACVVVLGAVHIVLASVRCG